VRADWIVAISENTRRHFLSVFPHVDPERTAVIYPASRFTEAAPIAQPDRLSHLSPGGFWLSVGTLEPRKNHVRLIEAYRLLKAKLGTTFPLVLAGGQGWMMPHVEKLTEGLAPGREIVLTGYASDDELQWLFANCFGFIYPSLFEGFGMPVLEALTLGAPVLCSNTTSLPEAAGDAALYFDPSDTESIANAMQRLGSGEVSRNALRAAALEQSKRFSWAGSAARLRALYEEVNGRSDKRRLTTKTRTV
jgi:glycosyltransferase involved in cell wall biosynthesis